MRLRLLPVTIGLIGLLLVSKSAELLVPYGLGRWALGGAVVPSAVAASAEPTHAAHGDKPPAPPAAPTTEHAAATRMPATKAVTPPPPAPISDEERQLLQELKGRKQEWDARARTLAQREGVLNAAEQRLALRANELSSLQAQLEQLEKSRVDRDDANWAGLVKVYEGMKPREAALIFNDMDMPVLLQLADRMKEAKAGPILAAMAPDRAGC